jgi:uncharacterized RDD family membrane protein YckC
MACFVYEAMILFGLGLIPGAVGAVAMATIGSTYPGFAETAVRTFAFLFYGLYFVWFWVRRGQTLPMQTWHIRIQTRDGARLRAPRAIARYVASWLWIAPAALLGAALRGSPLQSLAAVGAWILVYAALSRLHPQRQFWHDALCGTRLVAERR